MEKWLDTPLIVTVVIATVGALVGIGIWVGRISTNLGHLKSVSDQDRENFKNSAEQDRKNFEETADADRATLRDFMREIRDDVKKIFQQLQPAASHGPGREDRWRHKCRGLGKHTGAIPV